MEQPTIIETLGAIAKVERVTSIESNVMKNSFVLENMEPFPGYHGSNLPIDLPPQSIFLVTLKKNSSERIMRVSQNIRKYFNEEFDACSGKICVDNDTFNCIRIKDLKRFELIPELQQCFVDEGIQFMKKRKLNARGIIQLKKHFVLQKTDEGIYKDLEDPMMVYIQIPDQIKWKVLLNITEHIKRNTDFPPFDAALGAIYLRNVVDVIRIYSIDMPLNSLKELRKRFIAEIKKY